MALYPYQQRVKALVESGRSVILQAPTGAGKTRAALAPFIESFFDKPADAFPQSCLYSVPMRVLANQFMAEYRELAQSYERRFRRTLEVTVQTGERPDDPLFEGDLIFATVDQTLANVLGVPYSVGLGRANINVAAVASSYLVFDEFHLYPFERRPVGGALPATLQLLRLLSEVTPFVLMTATFSEAMLGELEKLLGATIVSLPPDEVAAIETRGGRSRKMRHYQCIENTLTADAILTAHKEQSGAFRRSLAVCNTVERAQQLYLALRDHPERSGVRVELLHARFTRQDRSGTDGQGGKEGFVRAEFGPPDAERGYMWHEPDVIVAATQVVEVGLDITSWALHTEIAPANAIFQRAGRCARYPGEQGTVYVYDVPHNKRGEPNYAPYSADLSSATWRALRARAGAMLDFHGEQEVLNIVHRQADQELLDAMHGDEGRLWSLIEAGWTSQDTAVRRELIRQVDSRTILVHDHPEESLDVPYRWQGFSLWQGTLHGKYPQLVAWQDALALDWCLKYPVAIKPEAPEDAREPEVFRWLSVRSDDDLSSSLVFVVHPQLAAYDHELGFRFEPSDGSYLSVQQPKVSQRAGGRVYSYQLESYTDHVTAMIRLYRQYQAARQAYAAARLEGVLALEPDSIDRATRLAIALHDLGKLEVRWQKWAHEYQRAIGEPLDDPNFMAAHTHSENEAHRKAATTLRFKRPHHAGEGAMAAARILHRASHGQAAFRYAALSAIARHHSSGVDSAEPYTLHRAARDAVTAALRAAGFDAEAEFLAGELLTSSQAPLLEKQLLKPPPDHDHRWWLLYFLIVRALRLVDGGSLEG